MLAGKTRIQAQGHWKGDRASYRSDMLKTCLQHLWKPGPHPQSRLRRGLESGCTSTETSVWSHAQLVFYLFIGHEMGISVSTCTANEIRFVRRLFRWREGGSPGSPWLCSISNPEKIPFIYEKYAVHTTKHSQAQHQKASSTDHPAGSKS